MSLLLHLDGVDEAAWARRLRPLLGTFAVHGRAEPFDPADISYILAWKPAPDAFAGLDRLKAVLSYGAGVDALLAHPGLPADAPVVRFVDPDLTYRMRDYVVAEVLAHTRLESHFRAAQSARRWIERVPPRAEEVTVGVMGLGVLGSAALTALCALGFSCRGWSRTPRDIEGVAGFAGLAGLDLFLAGTDILVCLLPLTPATRGILDRRLFARLRHGVLPGGPAVINAGRGGHLVDRRSRRGARRRHARRRKHRRLRGRAAGGGKPALGPLQLPPDAPRRRRLRSRGRRRLFRRRHPRP